MRALPVCLLAATAVVVPAPALTQTPDLAALQEQLAAMQAEVARLAAQVAALQAAEQAREAAPAPAAPASETEVEWKGAPELTGEGGWSFKPRGRLQVDTAAIDAPAAIPGDSLGFGTELRR